MPLFLARHSHAPEQCPAATPEGAACLLAHISAATAARYGVAIQAEAVIEDHTLYLVLEAATREQVDRYMATFARIGAVRVCAAISGEEMVARRGCAARGDGRPGCRSTAGQACCGAPAAPAESAARGKRRPR